MKQSEVKIGAIVECVVSGSRTHVRVLESVPDGKKTLYRVCYAEGPAQALPKLRSARELHVCEDAYFGMPPEPVVIVEPEPMTQPLPLRAIPGVSPIRGETYERLWQDAARPNPPGAPRLVDMLARKNAWLATLN